MSLIALIGDLQRQFHDVIAGDITALHESGSAAAFGSLALAGFVYGILHALGPGHGKFVIGSYMLTDDTTLRKGLVITGLSSLMQSTVAVVLVLVLFFVMNLARAQTEYAAAWLECISFGMIAILGAILVFRGVRDFGHVHGVSCGHNHAPIVAGSGWKTFALMVGSIGIRPCSGALILMLFACLLGEVWAGVAATFAMGAGTAITVGVVAMAAAGSKRGLLTLAGSSEKILSYAGPVARIAGGALLLFLGGLFCYAALPHTGGDVISPYNHPLSGHRR